MYNGEEDFVPMQPLYKLFTSNINILDDGFYNSEFNS